MIKLGRKPAATRMIPDCLTLNISGRRFENLSRGSLKAVRLKESEWLTKRLEKRYRFIRIGNGLRFVSSAFVARFDHWTLDAKKYTLHIGDILAHKPLGFDAYDPALFAAVDPSSEHVDTEWGVPNCLTFNVFEAAFKVMVTGEKTAEYRECTQKFRKQMDSQAAYIKVVNGYHPNNEAFIAEYLGAEEQDNINASYSNGLVVEMDKAIVFKIGRIIAYRFVPGKPHTHYTDATFGAPLVRLATRNRKPATDGMVAKRKAALKQTANDVISSNSPTMMLFENIEMLKAACAVRRTLNIPLEMRLMAKGALAVGGRQAARLILSFFDTFEASGEASAAEPSPMLEIPLQPSPMLEIPLQPSPMLEIPLQPSPMQASSMQASSMQESLMIGSKRKGQKEQASEVEQASEGEEAGLPPKLVTANRKRLEKKRKNEERIRKLHEANKQINKRKADDIGEIEDEDVAQPLRLPPTRQWTSKEVEGTVEEAAKDLEEKLEDYGKLKERRIQKKRGEISETLTDIRNAKRRAEFPQLVGKQKRNHEIAMRAVAARTKKQEEKLANVQKRAFASKKKRKLIVEPEEEPDEEPDEEPEEEPDEEPEAAMSDGGLGGQSISGGSFGLDGQNISGGSFGLDGQSISGGSFGLGGQSISGGSIGLVLVVIIGICTITGLAIGLALSR